ncbi:pitrilysin family protein [Acidipila sp. EB88]|uniref:M16 family metallopeptidase n=1 Tax=Acidipila sp. EB88 TaxID=2305226 RepID=UPI000F5E5C12|nr:pitrilysin family protein [Acidipila sp. EB88]RRA47414.1 insulinase family protein [Acidipila sp. EB88]
MNRQPRLALLLAASLLGTAHAQQTTHPVVPPDARNAALPGAWQQLNLHPLAPFVPHKPRRIELPNGALILLQEDHELPFISGFIEMHGGSRDVPAAKAGMMELYGEVWRTSGTATQSGDALDDLLEAKAAKIETSADVDSSSISWSCLKGDHDQVLALVTDLLLHPKWDAAKLELAQQENIAGILRQNDDPGGIAAREAAKLVYGGASAYGRSATVASVLGVSVADFEAFHARTVAPNNMIIGIEGDFDAVAMEAKLRAAIGALPKGTALPKPADTFAGPKPGLYLVDKKDVNQSNVWIVGLGIRRDDPDFYTLSVLNEIFGGGFGSRLFQDVRTRLGLAYSVGGGVGASFDHPGMLRVEASTKSASTIEASAEMLKDTAALRTEPFTEDELKLAKDQVLNGFIFNYDTREKVLSATARLAFYGYPDDYLERYRAGVEKVTVADLERVAKTRIDPSKLAVLVVGNQAEFGEPLSQLKLGPAQPVDITIQVPEALRKQMGGGGADGPGAPPQ